MIFFIHHISLRISVLQGQVAELMNILLNLLVVLTESVLPRVSSSLFFNRFCLSSTFPKLPNDEFGFRLTSSSWIKDYYFCFDNFELRHMFFISHSSKLIFVLQT